MLRAHAIGVLLATAILTLTRPARAAWESKTLAGADTRIYTPGTLAKIGDGRGLLVVLHGCTQSAEQLQEFGNFELAAEEFGWVIAIPNVPGGGVVAGCWDYYGAVHTRSSGHNPAIIGLAEALRDDPAYDIDPAQIYLSGLSSGAGQSIVTGCLAPELFAGMGIVAGPAVGTSISQIASVGTTASQAATVCRQLAGDSPDLQTQLAIAYTDTSDFVVAQGYAELNAAMYGELFSGGLEAMAETAVDVASLEGDSPTGTGKVWSDDVAQRVMWLQTEGNGHNWPAGSGQTRTGLTYVSGNGVNFSYVMAEFFTANSLRAEGDWEPGDSGSAETDGGSTDSSGDDSSTDTDGGGQGSDTRSDTPTDGSSGDGADTDTADPPGAGTESAGAETDGRIEPSGCQCNVRTVDDRPGLAGLALLALGLIRRRRG